MDIANKTVGEIVAENFRTSTVLANYHIDFCCGGGATLEEACKEKGLQINEVMDELEQSLRQRDARPYLELNPTDLIKEIVEVHHDYVRSTIPAIQAFLSKLCQVHGERHPELFEVRDLFIQSSDALLQHMEKEEIILFPYVKAMEEARKNEFGLSKPHFGEIGNPISVMEDEHENEGARFKKLAELTNNYTCPPDGCQTYQIAFAMLKEFEQDLHKHIHLENNILFPKAKKMYQTFDFQ